MECLTIQTTQHVILKEVKKNNNQVRPELPQTQSNLWKVKCGLHDSCCEEFRSAGIIVDSPCLNVGPAADRVGTGTMFVPSGGSAVLLETPFLRRSSEPTFRCFPRSGWCPCRYLRRVSPSRARLPWRWSRCLPPRCLCCCYCCCYCCCCCFDAGSGGWGSWTNVQSRPPPVPAGPSLPLPFGRSSETWSECVRSFPLYPRLGFFSLWMTEATSSALTLPVRRCS